MYGESCFVALDVKNGAQVRPTDLKGLRAFSEDFPEARVALLYRGERRVVGGVLCLPIAEFLVGLHPATELLLGQGRASAPRQPRDAARDGQP